MSSVNIKRAVDNIKVGTNVYTPLVEVVVNAIQAIAESARHDGIVDIVTLREKQITIDESLPDVVGFAVRDNGIGFTDENRDSFDTLYSAHKITEGGKGFGRFTCLKYFDEISVESIFRRRGKCMKRTFEMGQEDEIIIKELVEECDEEDTGSIVRLEGIRNVKIGDKKLSTIAKVLVERLLPYFFDQSSGTPKIILREEDDGEEMVLNDFLRRQEPILIKEIPIEKFDFELRSTDEIEVFHARVFRFYSPRTKVSKISLVAHKREVVETSLHRYIPEFSDEFFEHHENGDGSSQRNYIVKVYVSGGYLDKHVCVERGGFEFQRESDLLFGISQTDIEKRASELAREATLHEVSRRFEKKTSRIKEYVRDRAPWHSHVVGEVDLSDVPYNPTDEQIESRLQSKKYEIEVRVRREVTALLASKKPDDLFAKANEIVGKISGSSRNDLIHYVALRRSVIDIFQKSLEVGDEGGYSSEGLVHDIIFPRKESSETVDLSEHNLWLLDERLNFTEYLSSDIPLKDRSDRPDVIAYDKRIVFRGENEASNPVTVFEFKKPKRDDFVNPSSKEDPVQQIIRYVMRLRANEFDTPKGREIQINETTPFYGYIVCDLTRKVKDWIENEKDFKPMPDRMGYFKWHENLNLYIEVLSWDKVLKDATMRNRIFFHKLGI